jgi:phosphopantothenate---cysteine ligase (CTP)
LFFVFKIKVVNVLVTVGPAYEPIDQVRRITNHSTGSLGSGLCHSFQESGYEVTCLLGCGSVIRPARTIRCLEFTTNESLLELLRKEASSHNYGAIFHVAALSDYRVSRVHDNSGSLLDRSKLSSREGSLTLHLEPSVKVLPELRKLFPKALIVGWKYELEGTREDVVAKGYRNGVGRRLWSANASR